METKTYEIVDSVEALQGAIARVRAAQRVFATYTQEQVDKIFLAAASAADQARITLAKLPDNGDPYILLLSIFVERGRNCIRVRPDRQRHLCN